MNITESYDFYNAATNYLFSTANENRYIPSSLGLDATQMYNHLVSPRTLSSLIAKIGITDIYSSLVAADKQYNSWVLTNGTTARWDGNNRVSTGGIEHRYFDLSSISQFDAYQGLQLYHSGGSLDTYELNTENFYDRYPRNDQGNNPTIWDVNTLNNFLKTAYCRDFGNMNKKADFENVHQNLDDDVVKASFRLPIHSYSNYNYIHNELSTLYEKTSSITSSVVMSSASIQSLLQLIYNFLNNVYIYYSRVIERKKHVDGYLQTGGSKVKTYYKGAVLAINRFFSWKYVGYATPLVIQVDNKGSTSTRYKNLAKIDGTKNLYNASTASTAADFPDLIEIKTSVESEENTFDIQSTEGSNGSFQVTKKYEYSKVHPLDPYELNDIFDMFDIKSGKEISFGKVYNAIKFLFDLWVSNVSYFQVTTFVCHSNCHLNSFSGVSADVKKKIYTSITYVFHGTTDPTNVGLYSSDIARNIFKHNSAMMEGYSQTESSITYVGTLGTDKSFTYDIIVYTPTREILALAQNSDLPGIVYTSGSEPAITGTPTCSPSNGITITRKSTNASSHFTTYTVKVANADTVTYPLRLEITAAFNTQLELVVLTIDPNGGTFAYDDEPTSTVIHLYIQKNEKFGNLYLTSPTKPFSEFAGWKIGSTDVGSDYTFTSDTTIKAIYGVSVTLWVGSTLLQNVGVEQSTAYRANITRFNNAFAKSEFNSKLSLQYWSLSDNGPSINDSTDYVSAFSNIFAVVKATVSLYRTSDDTSPFSTLEVDYMSQFSANKDAFNAAFASAYPDATLDAVSPWKDSTGTTIASAYQFTQHVSLYANEVVAEPEE